MEKERKVSTIRINLMIPIVIIILIILIIMGIRMTMARYKSRGEGVISTDIAFYVLKESYQEGNIFLKDIYPREETYDYEFTVSNSDGTNRAETDLQYEITLEITTNLPLEFQIYRNNQELTKEEDIEQIIALDSSGQYYIKTIKIKNREMEYKNDETDTYIVSAKFPEKYNEYEEYEGLIDNVNIKLNSKQKLE